MPGDRNYAADFYHIMRKWLGVFDGRRRTRERCRDCFKTRWYAHKGGYRRLPVRGCDGCAEMENCYEELRAYFAADAGRRE